ncbi:MAG: UDP-N-acetylmuramate dehydrogenase [Sulfurospirillaceae bacterium]|nr:UDP-N-acetylmuramate dehydrogenase [Sulfurospirillaceae bacterium]MDD2826883.1 UDP-N-acetylmuramate dehydrogenase [Sulfurospirillaceae bacterium]
MKKIINFSTYSSIKVGPSIEVEILEEITSLPRHTRIIGGANNLLVSPIPPPLAMLGKTFDFIHLNDNILHVGGATSSGKILTFAKKHNLAGFELMQKLPGTLGGMVKMNAGLKEWEVFNNLLAIHTNKGWIDKQDIPHGYRHTDIDGIVYEATFACKEGFDETLLAMFKKMRDNQPPFPSAGSCFKNPIGNYAGKLIEDVGLKGKRIGNMAFSEQHANFLINLGGGKYEEAIALITFAKNEVLKQYGVQLVEEIIIL